jgi:hypothetical protein
VEAKQTKFGEQKITAVMVAEEAIQYQINIREGP